MRSLVILSILLLNLASAMVNPNKSLSIHQIVMPYATFLPSRSSISKKIHIIQADVHPANIHKVSEEIKESAWMERCCGLNGDYKILVNQVNNTELKFSFNCIDMSKKLYEFCYSDLTETLDYLNEMFEDFDRHVREHLYRYDYDIYEENIKVLVSYGDEFKKIHDSLTTSQHTKHFIEKMCVDMFTNILLMGASLGPNAPINFSEIFLKEETN
ncbi:uncharacterized protein LOC116338715 isoform X2 [Contarinia nasturtii]|uniref:uncharacterized protein LOC116338715 isoform X2 n=1 Tax=Contarinia nasturtii TaxID=265458 RepID=UPI0012D48F63|nr:uncharacterized protein LOC116338715 isoform X2 [Contarinia nasturtii]